MAGELLKWVDADGGEHDLTDPAVDNAKVLMGQEGRFMPPVRHITEAVPLHPGARLRESQTLVREYFLPVAFKAANDVALRAALREWLSALNVHKGPGYIRVTAPAGDIRILNCIYAGGMEGVEDAAHRGRSDWMTAAIVFHAHDPYWYAAADTAAAYVLASPSLTPFFPFFPLQLTPSSIFADTTITNTGDVDAWPIWTITGPGSSLALRNLTTNLATEISHTLAAGDQVVIDTRPYYKTIKLNGTTNLYGSLDPESSLWPLAAGANNVRVELTGANANSEVTLSYRLGYLGA